MAEESTTESGVLSRLEERFRAYRQDPVRFAWEFLGIETWSKQQVMLRAVQECPRVGVPSGHGLGKTHGVSVVAWWWMLCHKPAKVVITSSGGRQAEQQVGAEIGARYAEMCRRFTPEEMAVLGLANEPKVTGWRRGEDDFMIWFSTSADNASEHATRMTGWHSKHLLIVLDEAGGIAKPIWTATQGNLAGGHRHLLATGNPNDPTSEFARFCRRSDVRTIRLNALEFPNVVQGREVLPYGPNVAWIEEMRRLTGGENSPTWQWKVEGKFPTAGDDTLIGYADVNEAVARVPAECVHSPGFLGVGCDVARYGSDDSVVFALCKSCGAVVDCQVRHGQGLMETTGLVLAVAKEHGMEPVHARRIAIDDTGLGGGVTDRLRELGWNVRAVNAGEKPTRESEEEKFVNRRAELWWDGREWLRTTAALGDVGDELLDILRDELTSTRYSYVSDGRLKLEPKEALKKRIGKSPDYADALLLAVSALPRRGGSPQVSEQEMKRQTDPYHERDNVPPSPLEGLTTGHRDPRREFQDW